jgi:hypothetical protein
MADAEALWIATKQKYQGLFKFVLEMSVKDKRNLFYILRQHESITPDTFIPAYGLHCGEFACFQILAEHVRKEMREPQEQSLEQPPQARLHAEVMGSSA